MPVDPALITMIWPRRSTATPEHRWLRELISEILTPLNTVDRPLWKQTPS